MKTKIVMALIINACVVSPTIAGDIYRWTDPETGKVVTTPSVPPYPIKETRTAGGLPNGSLVNVILDAGSPEVKAAIEKRKAKEAEEKRIADEKEKAIRKAEEKQIADEKSRLEYEAQKKQIVSGKWYEGGTLHKSTVVDWLVSDETNKLATCGDWAINHKKVKSVVMRSQNIDSLKPFAYELCQCMNKATSSKVNQRQQTSEVAAACMILMWGNP